MSTRAYELMIIVDGDHDDASVDQIVTEVYEKIARNQVTIFDPWRTYPKGDNVVYYGK